MGENLQQLKEITTIAFDYAKIFVRIYFNIFFRYTQNEFMINIACGFPL